VKSGPSSKPEPSRLARCRASATPPVARPPQFRQRTRRRRVGNGHRCARSRGSPNQVARHFPTQPIPFSCKHRPETISSTGLLVSLTQPHPPRWQQSLHENISLDGLFALAYSSAVTRYLGMGDHDPQQRGLMHATRARDFDGAVDRTFEASRTLFSNGQWTMKPKSKLKKLMQTTNLPVQPSAERGPLLGAFGRLKPTHIRTPGDFARHLCQLLFLGP